MARKVMVAVVAMVLVAGVAAAQEAMQPKKLQDVQWYQIMHVKYEPGAMKRAQEIITEYFAPAGMESKTNPEMVFVHVGGDWDMTIVWPLREGLADLEWELHPDDVRWMESMAKRTGGMERALELWQEYEGLVKDVRVDLARSWGPPARAAEAK